MAISLIVDVVVVVVAELEDVVENSPSGNPPIFKGVLTPNDTREIIVGKAYEGRIALRIG